MGLFNNYTKPGPGIDKDAPKKKGIFLYFEILVRKLGKLAQANMIYFVCSIPMFLIYYLFFGSMFIGLTDNVLAGDETVTQEAISMLTTMLTLFFTITSVVLMGSGPASASLSYIMREYAKEEHVWLWSTFFAKMKENFKQGIIVSVVDVLYTVCSTFALSFYFGQYLSTGSVLWFFMLSLMVIFTIVYIFMHYYVYQLMVTFESKTAALYKNAFLLALSTMPVNLILTIVICVISFMLFSFLNPIISLILAFIVLISLFRFPFEFYAQSVIKKRILNNIQTENKKDEFEYYPEPQDWSEE